MAVDRGCDGSAVLLDVKPVLVLGANGGTEIALLCFLAASALARPA